MSESVPLWGGRGRMRVPEATRRRPSVTSACVSTVLVVVPSPARWSVFEATSTSSFAPVLALASSSSMSRAMVTPSLTTSGTPKLRSSTTLRPLGPSVTLTALATASIPASSDLRLASPNWTSVAMRGVAARIGATRPTSGACASWYAPAAAAWNATHAASMLSGVAELFFDEGHTSGVVDRRARADLASKIGTVR